MNELIKQVVETPSHGIVVAIIICITFLTLFILFLIGAKLGLISKFRFRQLEIDGKQSKEIEEKRYKSGSLEHLLRDQITKLDLELIDYAMDRSNFLRKSLTVRLSDGMKCSGTRRALVSCLRYPLYFASLRNHFKDALKPENIKGYTERLMKEIIAEYEEFSVERDEAHCVKDINISCPSLVPINEITDMICKKVVEDWASPIRQKNIEICQKKIQLYEHHIHLFEDLEDNRRVKITEECVNKNKGYISALSRKPDNPGEF